MPQRDDRTIVVGTLSFEVDEALEVDRVYRLRQSLSERRAHHLGASFYHPCDAVCGE